MRQKLSGVIFSRKATTILQEAREVGISYADVVAVKLAQQAEGAGKNKVCVTGDAENSLRNLQDKVFEVKSRRGFER